MAFLLGNIDPDTMRLIGCWNSNEMICCLNVITLPLMQSHTEKMVDTEYYTLISMVNSIHITDYLWEPPGGYTVGIRVGLKVVLLIHHTYPWQ